MPPPLSEEPQEFVIRGRIDGKRIDAYLSSRFWQFSRTVVQKLIDAEAVLVNKRPVRASYRLRDGDLIRIWLPELHDEVPKAEDIPLEIVYEDEVMTVVHKPAGMVVHPAKGNWSGTLVNALQYRYESLSSVGGAERPGIVHRLDRDTSGLILIARTDEAHRALAHQFEYRTIHKEYLALVYGRPERDSDYIERLIGPHPTVREKMAIRLPEDGGKPAVTFFEVLEKFDGYALVRCKPETGRTHQIRVHMNHIGLPIIADKLYSGRDRLAVAELLGTSPPSKSEPSPVAAPETIRNENDPDAPESEDPSRLLMERQALHAHRLRLIHPKSKRSLELVAPLPQDMETTLNMLRTHRPAREKPVFEY